MSTAFDRRVARHRRHHRIRKTVAGTPARPRLVVFRASRHISAQVGDDSQGRTLASASTQQAGVADGLTGVAAAAVVGRLVAERASDAGVQTVIFDRGGYRFHGRVAALAEAAREGGLGF